MNDAYCMYLMRQIWHPKNVQATVFMHTAYSIISFIFSVHIIYLIIPSFSDKTLFQIYVSICMLICTHIYIYIINNYYILLCIPKLLLCMKYDRVFQYVCCIMRCLKFQTCLTRVR